MFNLFFAVGDDLLMLNVTYKQYTQAYTKFTALKVNIYEWFAEMNEFLVITLLSIFPSIYYDKYHQKTILFSLTI